MHEEQEHDGGIGRPSGHGRGLAAGRHDGRKRHHQQDGGEKRVDAGKGSIERHVETGLGRHDREISPSAVIVNSAYVYYCNRDLR